MFMFHEQTKILNKSMTNNFSVGGPFTRVDWEQMNLNSYTQVKDYLLNQCGWVPDEWNEKRGEDGKTVRTSPKLTESSYHTITGDIGRDIADRAVLLHRRRLLFNISDEQEFTGLINLVREDGRIAAEAFTLATPTGRYRHKGLVNIPKASDDVLYGKEFRSLFIAPDDKVFVGCDATALEARSEAHYCYPYPGGPEYVESLINGTKDEGTDVHSINAKALGRSRDIAKTFKYAITYGAGVPKLARTVGCSRDEAEQLFSNFWDSNTSLKGFKDDISRAWNKRGGKNGGWLKGLDNRKIRPRSESALVNYMFQSAGIIIVKTATILCNLYVQKYKLDAKQVLHMHDEFLYECNPNHAEDLAEIAKRSFKEAGKRLKVNVPITGDAQIGRSWCEVH